MHVQQQHCLALVLLHGARVTHDSQITTCETAMCLCRGIYYSFAAPPQLDIAVRPLGVALPHEFLGLGRALTALLQRIINRRLVEPQRRFFDLQRMYTNKHVARVGFLPAMFVFSLDENTTLWC
jgi:hypothetical protein